MARGYSANDANMGELEAASTMSGEVTEENPMKIERVPALWNASAETLAS